jgi:hypothetical protein
MPYCEFFCHSCKQAFTRTLDAIDYQEIIVMCPNCASEDVEERFFYTVATKKSA